MKKIFINAILVLAAAAGLTFLLGRLPAEWEGVDVTVVEKFAEQAGRSAWKPLINTDQGDLLLFFFLTAGVVGGFVGGYCFRELFPPKSKD